MVKEKLFTGPQARDELGTVSARQLDYWVTQGYVPVTINSTGSGTKRYFSEKDIEFISLFSKLMALGIHPHLCKTIIKKGNLISDKILIKILPPGKIKWNLKIEYED